MFGNRKAVKAEAAIREQFPLYPFDGPYQEDPELCQQRSAYILQRLGEVGSLDAVPGECEYVGRSAFLPDRRLTIAEQRMWRAMDVFPETPADRALAELFN